MAKSTNYRGIHISVTYAMGYDYYEISQINKGKKWNDKTLFATLKEAKMYIDEHYDELIKNESKKSVKIHEGRKVDTFIIYYEERNGETDGYEVYGVQQLKDALKWLHSDKIDVVKITVYKRGKDFDNNHDDVTEYYSWKESKTSARKSLKESKTNYLTVEEFCNLCAKVFIHYEIWSFDGHNIYEESYDLSKIKYSSYKNHDVLMWDFDKDVLILYIENNAIPF